MISGFGLYFFGPPCTLKNINVFDCSPVFDDILQGRAAAVNYFVNGREYHLAYYMTDGIYHKWAILSDQFHFHEVIKHRYLLHIKYLIRKDVERGFGVLQAIAIVKDLTLFWDKVKIGKIMRACIILHNMIVEDEKDGYTHFNVSEFE